MPIDFDGESYRLTYLDTNAMSELCKRGKLGKALLLALVSRERTIPCYSPLSIIEIRKKTELFEWFIDCFGALPSMMMKGHDQLVEEEIRTYPDPSHVDAKLCSVWGLNAPGLKDPRDKLRKLIELVGVDKRRRKWERDRQIILKGMLSLVKNYPPSGSKYTKRETLDFVRKVNLQHLSYQWPEFIQKLGRSGQDFDMDAFPSLKMRGFSVFYRYYADTKRQPVLSDVFDILMSSVLPYVDVAYLERFQSEVVRKAERIDSFLSHLKVRTLADVRPGEG
jgi:hypothetical protein